MNMRIKLLIVFASVLTLIFAINLGVASADHPSTEGGITTASVDSIGGVGLTTGVVADHLPLDSPARGANPDNDGPVDGPLLSNNPLCPAHYGGVDDSPWGNGA